MVKITHPTQTEILKALIYEERLSFSDLNRIAAPEMSSDNFNFHIKRLIELGIIEKKGTEYFLDDKGVEFSSRIDLKERRVFKQPKLSIALGIFEDRTEKKILLTQRKYQPLKGFWGFHTEKMRFGEVWNDAISRCLLKETGILEFETQPFGVTHLLREDDGVVLADVIHLQFKIFPNEKSPIFFESEEVINEWVGVENVTTNYKTTSTFKVIFQKMLEDESIFHETIVHGRK